MKHGRFLFKDIFLLKLHLTFSIVNLALMMALAWCHVIANVSLSESHICPLQCWLPLIVLHLKGDFLSNFVFILIILNLSLWVLYYTVKLWNAYFWTTLGRSFTSYQRKCNLLKSSLWIFHLKSIKMNRKLDKKYSFTYAATWWSRTLESGGLKTLWFNTKKKDSIIHIIGSTICYVGKSLSTLSFSSADTGTIS